MIMKLKQGYRLDIKRTRREMRKRGFLFRTFRNKPQQFGIYLTEEGSMMYRNVLEALLAMRVVIITDDKISNQKVCKRFAK